MKKPQTPKRPLHLDTTTVRALATTDLAQANGGQLSIYLTSAHKWC